MQTREHVKACLALLALLCVYFHPALFGGKILSQADTVFSVAPWASLKPQGFEPSNYLLNDQTQFLVPGDIYAYRSIRKGVLPLWNPLCACGEPFVANYWSAVFSPLQLIVYVLSPPRCYAVSAVIRLWIAGFCTYLFLRVWRVRLLGAMIGALSFTFGGYMILWLNHRHTGAAMWLPVLLLIIEKWLRSSRRVFAALTAACVACMLLAGHAYACVHAGLALGVYVAARMLTLWHARPRTLIARLSVFLGACAIGVLMAAVQLLPFVEYLPLSALPTFRTDVAARAVSEGGPLWTAMVGLVHPFAFGTPLGVGNYFAEAFGLTDTNFNEMNGAYVGVATLTLAFWAVLSGRRRGGVKLFAGLALMSFAVAYRLPGVYDLFVRVPLLRLTVGTAQRSQLPMAFMLCCLAGMGLDNLLYARERRQRFRLRVMIIALSLPAVLAAAVVLVCAVWQTGAERICQAFLIEPYRSQPRVLAELTRCECWATARLLLCVAPLLGVICLRAARRLTGPALGGAVLLLVLGDLFTFGIRHNPTLDRSEFLPKTRGIAFLEERQSPHARICPYGAVLPPNTPMAYGLRSVQGTDKLQIRRYVRLGGLIRDEDMIGSPLLDLLSAEYLVLPPGARVRRLPKYELVYDGEMTVYRNRRAIPRAFVAGRPVIVESERDAAARLSAPDFDPREIVIVSSPLGIPEGAHASGEAKIVTDQAHYIRIAAEMSGEGVLVLSDMYYPGWRAFVNGRRGQIGVADLALRAVRLAAGSGIVEFVYAPRSFKLGMALTFLGVAVAMLWLVFPLIIWRPTL